MTWYPKSFFGFGFIQDQIGTCTDRENTELLCCVHLSEMNGPSLTGITEMILSYLGLVHLTGA